MEVICQLGRDSSNAGGILIACFKISNISNHRDYVLLAQACGHITLDPKWSNPGDNTSISFPQTTAYPLDHSIQLPHINNINSKCIFLTPREVISTTQINEGGVMIMIDLPIDLIPSYKGLTGSVYYHIILTLQSPGESNKSIRIPFTVLSGGSNSLIYEIRFSNLSTFGATSVPIENPLLPSLENESDDDEINLHMKNIKNFIPLNNVVFNIRDQNFICSLSMINQSDILSPGNYLTICLCFEESQQPCRAVRAYLQQCENRRNGSRVQDKIIVESSRSTVGAELIYLRLHLPDHMPCSFTCPIFQVNYQIVLEFFLDGCDDAFDNLNLTTMNINDNNDKIKDTNNKKNINKNNTKYSNNNNKSNDDQEPFTWSLPLDIIPKKYPTDLSGEINLCIDPITEHIQKFI